MLKLNAKQKIAGWAVFEVSAIMATMALIYYLKIGPWSFVFEPLVFFNEPWMPYLMYFALWVSSSISLYRWVTKEIKKANAENNGI